jgi:hypothetical protein
MLHYFTTINVMVFKLRHEIYVFCGRRKKQRTISISHDEYASTYGDKHIPNQNEVSESEGKNSNRD